MKKYIINNIVYNGDNNAGSKAGRDAVEIAKKNAYEFVKLYQSKGNHTTISNFLEGYLNTWKLCRKLEKGDIVLLQYPVNRQLMNHMYKILNKKKVHIVTLIHDIDFLRNVSLGNKGVKGMQDLELSLLSQSEYVIAHNSSMIRALTKAGLHTKFLSLELFDYLYDGSEAERIDDDSLIVAGNLLEQKAGYLYKLKNHKFKLSLYGANLGDNFENSNAEYHGSFAPDDLIENLAGAYGLVWDGSEVDTCAGSYGQYLKINNPHKVSLYMAAGLPVIVWKQSALYPFVMENGVGFGVDSLLDIDGELKRQDYDTLVENVKKIQKKVRSGEFLERVLRKIERENLKDNILQYTDKYDFSEYKSMCDMFKDIRLKFAREYEVNGLLASYVFGYTTNRFPIGKINIMKRFFGSFFVYPVDREGIGSKTAILFTGPDRDDYWDNLRSVAKQGENVSIYSIDRNHPQIYIKNMGCFVKQIIWTCQINNIVHNFWISFDMAVSIYRTIVQAKCINRYLKKGDIKSLIFYCDQWSTENAVSQIFGFEGGMTATLQHGNGTEIFYPIPSQYYLANSKLSAQRAIKFGVKEEKIIVAEPMKYIGRRFDFNFPKKYSALGVVLDGGESYDNNVQMIRCGQRIAKQNNIQCYLKFHPSTNVKEYNDVIDKNTIIEKNQVDFLRKAEVFICCNSTFYQELIYEHRPVLRFRNPQDDWYPEIDGLQFQTEDELSDLFNLMVEDRNTFEEKLAHIYKKIFGDSGEITTYKTIFEKMGG